TEPNNERRSAQRVELPLIVNGRIDRPGDWDVFRLKGRAGEEITAEIQARRLRSPVDSLLKLTDKDGRILAANDDYVDKGAGLTTHHADSKLSFQFPANGIYWLHVGDTQHKGGTDYSYRLRISPRRRDFELRVVPSRLCADAGSSIAFTVYALRRDGFSGEITLALQDAESGFALGGGWIPADQDKVRLTLTLPRISRTKAYRLHMAGSAMVDGEEIRRSAVPAEDMMQAFLWRHLVPMDEWVATVNGARRPLGPPARVLAKEPVRIPAGGNAQVRIAVPGGTSGEQIQVELIEPPEGITVQEVSHEEECVSIVLCADVATVTPGLQGNLIAKAFKEKSVPDRNGKEQPNQRISLGTLPAIPFKITGK
ncbi:hypothetical protein HQ590_16725, partial [bacterium]|nr:hypothetical protein [bacterium]